MKTNNIILTRRRFWTAIGGYLAVAGVVFCIAPLIGGETLSVSEILSPGSTDREIFFTQRIPRVLLGFLVGGSLALVGATFQAILRNPLAAPYTLGVSGSASVGAVLAISIPQTAALNWAPFSPVQLCALTGASATTLFIYLIARRSAGISMTTLLLAGVTISILCSSTTMLIRYLVSPHLLVSMDRWMMGGLDVAGYRQIAALPPLLLPGIGLLIMQTPGLNHLSLGEDMAMGHGVDVVAVQRRCFIGGSIITATVVSISGPIMFVGLLAPHVVRMISGCDHRIVMPAAFLAGGAFLTACDAGARTIAAPAEMPVGIITALTGGPFFIYLLLRRNNK